MRFSGATHSWCEGGGQEPAVRAGRGEASFPQSAFAPSPPLPYDPSPQVGITEQSPFLPSPPNTRLSLSLSKTPQGDKINPRNLAIKRSVSSASYQGCLIKGTVPRAGYRITK